MSEQHGELPVKIEKEQGAVGRVAERMGKFLAEHYTFKGATAKELQGLDRVVGHFTPSQQNELKSYYESKAVNNARWKVIRNWVATGAGLTLGGAILANPAGAVNTMLGVAKFAGEWWAASALPALAKVGATLGAPFTKIGEGIATGMNKLSVVTSVVLDKMFDVTYFPAGIPWDKLRPTGLNIPPFPELHIPIKLPDFTKVIGTP